MFVEQSMLSQSSIDLTLEPLDLPQNAVGQERDIVLSVGPKQLFEALDPLLDSFQGRRSRWNEVAEEGGLTVGDRRRVHPKVVAFG